MCKKKGKRQLSGNVVNGYWWLLHYRIGEIDKRGAAKISVIRMILKLIIKIT